MGLTRASVIAGMITIILAATVTPVAAQDQIGRYQIIISTIGDQTFLLDTTNGSVWQLVRFPELKTEPMAWQSMLTINSAADYDALAKRYGKATEAPPQQ